MDILPSSPEFSSNPDRRWLKNHGIDPSTEVTPETLATVLDKEILVVIANPVASLYVEGFLYGIPGSNEIVLTAQLPATNESFDWTWSLSSLGLDPTYKGEVQAHVYRLAENDE